MPFENDYFHQNKTHEIMRFIVLTLMTFGLFVAVQSTSWAQSNSSEAVNEEGVSYVRLVMYDGTTRMGELIDANANEFRIRTRKMGDVVVPKYLVQGVVELTADQYVRLTDSVVGRALSLNPQSSRYFFAPSGIQLKQGEGYFQSNIALNSVSLGVNDHITIGGLISFVGAGGSLKIGKELAPNVHASFGGIGFTDYYGELERPVGLMFANITWGTEDRNLTINIGTGSKFEVGLGDILAYTVDSVEYSYNPGYFYPQYTLTEYEQLWVRPLLLNVSAMNQIAENRWFITENYLIRNIRYAEVITGANLTYGYLPSNNSFSNNQNQGVAILSMGIRNLSTRNGWLWDYGMVGVIAGDFGFAAPWVSATLAF